MFLTFLEELRAAKIPASMKEHLMMLEALQGDVIDYSIIDFYYLARPTYGKDEGLLYRFGQVFGKGFKGVEPKPECQNGILEDGRGALAEKE